MTHVCQAIDIDIDIYSHIHMYTHNPNMNNVMIGSTELSIY